VLISIPISAQNQDSGTAQNQMPAEKMEKMHHGKDHMMGKHMMKATVSSVDKKTGLVKVNAGGMDLTVHFPPDSLASVNPNDTITLHLGFSK
jgi:hypothetical protein